MVNYTLHLHGLRVLTYFIIVILAYFDLHYRQFMRYFEQKNQSRVENVGAKCLKNKRLEVQSVINFFFEYRRQNR